MRKKKHFNITRTNGTECINDWLTRGIEAFAKREYGLNIKVVVSDPEVYPDQSCH